MGVPILFCEICKVKVTYEKQFIVLQQLKTDKHICGIERLGDQLQKIQLHQKLILSNLYKTLLAAKIPINKLYNTYFRTFLEKYTHKDILSVSCIFVKKYLCQRVLL